MVKHPRTKPSRIETAVKELETPCTPMSKD